MVHTVRSRRNEYNFMDYVTWILSHNQKISNVKYTVAFIDEKRNARLFSYDTTLAVVPLP
jgi:hypothetical protein